ncbi:MAG: hypothetical protein K0U61_02570 [Alphaproteobacteria bacterium]|nr:hypothetical protein [Alphaproteobacteria bacterium]
MATPEEIESLRQQFGLRPGETLPDKWRREHAKRLAALRAISNDELEDELRECGCDEALIAVVIERMR